MGPRLQDSVKPGLTRWRGRGHLAFPGQVILDQPDSSQLLVEQAQQLAGSTQVKHGQWSLLLYTIAFNELGFMSIIGDVGHSAGKI